MLLAFVFCPPTHTNGIFFENLNTVFLLLFLSDVLCIFLFIESHTISKISFVEHLFLLPTTLIFCSQLLFYYFSCFWLNEIFYVMSMFYFFYPYTQSHINGLLYLCFDINSSSYCLDRPYEINCHYDTAQICFQLL